MPSTTTAPIFFSYAWRDNKDTDENREQIVDNLYNSLVADGYPVVRDKVDLGYGGIISEFMKNIGRGKYIVVVISDKYLKSPNCMFELLQIYRNSNSDINQMKDKIFPIILNDAKIYDALDRLNYSDYWKVKTDELNKKIIEVGLDGAADAVGDYKIYRDILNNIEELTGLLKNINTLDPAKLSQDNFATIKQAIQQMISNQGQPIGSTNNQPLQSVTASTSKVYNLGNMRKFFQNGLNDTDLNNFCSDNFEDVFNQFTDNMNKSIKINLLLDYCKRRLNMDKLLAAMEAENNAQFEQYKPYY